MRCALAVTRPGKSPEKNLQEILSFVEQASEKGAELVLFAEAAYTGLITVDDSHSDAPLFVPIPGMVSQRVSVVARQNNIFVGLGLLEQENEKFYDSAILIDDTGEIILKYRRTSSGWHSPQANSSIYCEGKGIPFVETKFGRIAFLLCGDLFDDTILTQTKALQLDLLLYPLARLY